MANTFELISSVTVGAGGTTIASFSSIPSTFTDLQLVGSYRTTEAGLNSGTLKIRFNSNFSSIYSYRELQGNGQNAGTAATGPDTSFDLNFQSNESDGNTANTFQSFQLYIPNYANTSYAKSASFESVSEQNGTNAYADLGALSFNSTTAISSIEIRAFTTNNVAQFSTFYLYGVKSS
jgi:hypothetical protein